MRPRAMSSGFPSEPPERGPSTPTPGRLGSGVLSQPVQPPPQPHPQTARPPSQRHTPPDASSDASSEPMPNDLSALAAYAHPHATPTPLAARDDGLSDEWGDLTPTTPQMISIPRLPVVHGGHGGHGALATRTPLRLTIGIAFSAFALAQDWIHDETLRAIPIEQRMRLFSALAPVYLRVLQTTGRMPVAQMTQMDVVE